MRMFNKVGAERALMEVLFELVLLVVLGLTMFAAVNSVRDVTAHNQKVVARDLALVRDAALAAPGRVEYPFPIKKELNVVIDDTCKLTVTAEGPSQKAPQFFFCGVTNDARLKSVVQEKKNVEDVQRYEITHAAE